MSASQRRKGKRTELELVAALSPFFPDARRYLEQTRSSSGRDIDGTPGVCFQLKSGAAPSWPKALAEATSASGDGEIPVGVTRRDRDGFVVHLALEDFLHALRWGAA